MNEIKTTWKKNRPDGQWIMFENGVQVALEKTKKDCRRAADAWGRKAANIITTAR